MSSRSVVTGPELASAAATTSLCSSTAGNLADRVDSDLVSLWLINLKGR